MSEQNAVMSNDANYPYPNQKSTPFSVLQKLLRPVKSCNSYQVRIRFACLFSKIRDIHSFPQHRSMNSSHVPLTSWSFGEGRRSLRAVVLIRSVAAMIHPIAPHVERNALSRLAFVSLRLGRPIQTSCVMRKQGRIHDCSCRGRLGRGSNDLGRVSDDLGRGSIDLGRGMLKYKLSNP